MSTKKAVWLDELGKWGILVEAHELPTHLDLIEVHERIDLMLEENEEPRDTIPIAAE